MHRESGDLAKGCPSARPSTVQSRALHLACQILGNASHLAKYLGVSEEQLLAWLEAREDVPYDLFVQVVGIILTQWEPREKVSSAARKH
jgi:hypothetical protein